jgi:hypothetical protein
MSYAWFFYYDSIVRAAALITKVPAMSAGVPPIGAPTPTNTMETLSPAFNAKARTDLSGEVAVTATAALAITGIVACVPGTTEPFMANAMKISLKAALAAAVAVTVKKALYTPAFSTSNDGSAEGVPIKSIFRPLEEESNGTRITGEKAAAAVMAADGAVSAKNADLNAAVPVFLNNPGSEKSETVGEGRAIGEKQGKEAIFSPLYLLATIFNAS